MEVQEFEKHVLEQARIEVEHTRSWPTKILAFYVAINAGIVTAIFSLSDRKTNPLHICECAKILFTLSIVAMFIWIIYLLGRNHIKYLEHRNIQICFQVKYRNELKAVFPFPDDSGWFIANKESIATRWSGWGFYAYLTVLVTSFTVAGIWVS